MTTGFTLEGNKWQQECQTDELVALKFKQLRIILINIYIIIYMIKKYAR